MSKAAAVAQAANEMRKCPVSGTGVAAWVEARVGRRDVVHRSG